MRKFLRAHTNSILIFLAVVFLGIITGYFIWGIGYIVTQEDAANSQNAGASQISGFNVQGAAALDYHGLAPATTTAAASSS